ncbi:polysaccharide deacetylase family protein [Pleomorphomonas sp. PLEO]|uniref:polysaccharide deacetylase family protein n=1 Tax=Pleomorphomonas sp. PLEO TaxID=3239306 RepID=UPI00351F766F
MHDLSEVPDACGDELKSWMPFSAVEPLLGSLLDVSRSTGAKLRITSDDAFRSDIDLLAPWLIRHGVDGIFFVPTSVLGQPGRLAPSDLRALAALGMEIGVHGARHIDWTSIPEREFLDDVSEGRNVIEDIIGRPVDIVAPPFGRFNIRILDRLFAMGFREVHTCRPGLALVSTAIKPRNMLKSGNIPIVLAVAERQGGWSDVARCRLRHLSTRFRSLFGVS